MESKARRRIPIEAGFFTIPEDEAEAPRLLGSRCNDCGEVFFPRRIVCAKCLGRSTRDVELGPTGTLYTFTYCHVPMFGKLDAKMTGYAVGQVDLPEGPRVQSVLQGARDDFEIGMQLELDLEVLRENDAGEQVMIYRFRPKNSRDSEAMA